MSTLPFVSQLRSLWQAVTGDLAGAKKTQEVFLDAWVHHPGQQISDLADYVPVVGHVKGLIHLAMGDTEAAARSEEAATRTLAVFAAGALTAGTGGAAAPILAGVVAGVAADAAITGIESYRHDKYDPQGYLDAVSEFSTDWRGGAFDIVALGVGDAALGADGKMWKTKVKTTKVFRVEGEGHFLTAKGKIDYGANSRLFAGRGGSVIESPNILRLELPPGETDPEPNPKRRPKVKAAAALCLNFGDIGRTETYYMHRMLQYREAVEKMQTTATTSSTQPTAFRFKIKSFRILTNDYKRMIMNPGTDEGEKPLVRRVDITKTQVSYEIHQDVYTPLIEKVVPNTFEEKAPEWMARLPTRLLQTMIDHHVAYGRVRTYGIYATKFGRTSLRANIAQKITDQELKRLEHAPVPLSMLSEEGLDSVAVQVEPVRRLRQSREVKCGRTLGGDVKHGKRMEYLAEFLDGSTAWIPSVNVAPDLKETFWEVMTTGAKEVAEIVSSDTAAGTVTVKRIDGSVDTVPNDHIFWQEEETPTPLTDKELEALLRHAHYGYDNSDLLPCTLTIDTDWVAMRLSKGAALMKDPAAHDAQEYSDCTIDSDSIRVGREHSREFMSRTIPLFLVNNGAPFDVTLTHGRDSINGYQRAKVVLTIADQRGGTKRFESVMNPNNIDQNPSTFRIYPIVRTPGLLVVETDWAAIRLDSSGATIVPDLTVDQSIYEKVSFSDTYMKFDSNKVFGKKFVIPFILLTYEAETINFTVTHGRDKELNDQSGIARVMFAQKTYTAPVQPDSQEENPKSFSNCKVNEWTSREASGVGENVRKWNINQMGSFSKQKK